MFNELKESGLGCYVGATGAFGYADDIALISPSIYSLKKMIRICESYAAKYYITFNPSKSKLLCFNVKSSDCAPIYLNKQRMTCVDNDML